MNPKELLHNISLNNELKHYGVIGMRWGVRRKRSSNIRKSQIAELKKNKEKETDRLKTMQKAAKDKIKEQEAKISPEHKRKVELKKKKISEMTNAELKEINNRLQLETQYRELQKKDMSNGQKFVRDIVVNAAGQTLGNLTVKAMGKGVDIILKEAL